MDRPTPTEEQVAQLFRALADEHAANRAVFSKEASWHRVQVKWQDRVRERTSPWSFFRGWRLRIGTLAVASGLVVAVSLIAVSLIPAEPEVLTFQVTGEGPSGQAPELDDGWLRTNTLGASLDFSDGSTVQLNKETLLNISTFGPHSALARIAEGKISADIHHADETNWSFLAGPYEVRVVGTAFDLSWEESRLLLQMHEGSVRVTGPNQQSWTVAKGENLELSPEPSPQPPTQPSDVSVEEPAADESSQNEPASESAEPPLRTKASQPTRKPRDGFSANWSELLGKGEFQQIVGEAASRGMHVVHRSAGAGDLATLAQAASYTGDASLSKDTWRKLRERFPGSASSTRGAFFLARLEEQQGQRSAAIRWLDTYLREAPGGVYAAEAHGRKLVLTRHMSGANSPRARKLARDYLERFPRGAYAETARATLAHR